jgi:ribokinase
MNVLTVGGAMLDTIAIIDSASIERASLDNAGSSFLLLEQGRKIEALEVSTHCGGGAMNTAVCFARLGLDVAVLAKLGRDRRAEQLIACLKEEHVSDRWVAYDDEQPTGSSVHVSSHDRNAAIFTFRGANTRLMPADLAADAFACDVVYIANLSNEAARCFPEIVEKAKAHGALVAANPGIRQLTSHGDTFAAMLPRLDILALNRREAEAVAALLAPAAAEDGPPLSVPKTMRPAPLAERGLRPEGRRAMGLRTFFRELLDRGVGCVVITDGRDGAFAASAGRLCYCPAEDVAVAGTAGAGDAFAATFTTYAALGRTPEEALVAASHNAASVLGFVDTQTGLLKRDVVEAFLQRQKSTPNVIGWSL